METQNQIDKFMKELSTSDFEKYEILVWLRNIVWDTFSKISETFKYGGILFSLKENFGGLFVSKKHTSFEFSYGYKLTSKLKLEGTGKYRRHLKVTHQNKEMKKDLIALLKQIRLLDND